MGIVIDKLMPQTCKAIPGNLLYKEVIGRIIL
jgi:hypothetical protein